MTMKEKVENILGKFLERNKEYAVNAYVRNGITGNSITRLFIPINRTAKSEEKNYSVEWEVDNIEYSDLSLPYEEIMDCYENNCEEDGLKIAELVVVLLNNGMKVELECVGDRI